MINVTRREALVLSASAATALMLSNSPLAKIEQALAAAKNTPKSLLETFTGGKAVAEGKINLDMPEIAENGNTVPLSFKIDSQMTKDDYVKRVIIISEGNPRPEVATFNFTPLSGEASASTRMRLAKTQNIIAVAELSDGSFHMAKTEVKVTIGGCGG